MPFPHFRKVSRRTDYWRLYAQPVREAARLRKTPFVNNLTGIASGARAYQKWHGIGDRKTNMEVCQTIIIKKDSFSWQRTNATGGPRSSAADNLNAQPARPNSILPTLKHSMFQNTPLFIPTSIIHALYIHLYTDHLPSWPEPAEHPPQLPSWKYYQVSVLGDVPKTTQQRKLVPRTPTV